MTDKRKRQHVEFINFVLNNDGSGTFDIIKQVKIMTDSEKIDKLVMVVDVILREITTIKNDIKKINERLDKHDLEFIRINERLDKHDLEFVRINERLDRHDLEFIRINERLDQNGLEILKINERLDQNNLEP